MHALEKSARNHLWGYVAPLNIALSTSQLVFADVPSWMARRWTVTLLAMRFSSGNLSGSLYTPDQQAVPTNFSNTNPVQVRCAFGVHNASERDVLIDYPWTGCTFEVTAASISLSLNPYNTTGLSVIPLLGAFIAPVGRGGGQLKNPPTFTQFVSVPSGSTVFVAVPPRARSYSIVGVNAPSTAQGVTLNQITTPDASTTILRFDTQAAEVPGTAPAAYEFFSGALVANYPLHPLATALSITTPFSIAAQYQVRFELDLG